MTPLSFTEGMALLDNLNEQMKKIQDDMHNVRVRMTLTCPVKIGDIVLANGHRQTGKDMEVSDITLHRDYKGSYDGYTCFGYALRANGNTGMMRCEHNIIIKK